MSVTGRRRALPWLLAALLASLFYFTSNGTFASWTNATIANPQNSVTTNGAVILRETKGSATCRSDDVAVNQSTCTTINSYGGFTAPLYPGVGASFFVSFSNVGMVNARAFSMTAGACSTRALDGQPAAVNLCSPGSLTMRVRCSAGTSLNAGALWTDLNYPLGPVLPAGRTLTHAATGGELNVNASWACEIRFELAANAPNEVQGATLVQSVTWALRA